MTPRTLGRAARGFTLVELVLVMTIIGIVAVLAAPGHDELTGLAQRNTRDQLRLLLEHARDSASTQRREICVTMTAAIVEARYALGGVCSGPLLQSPAGDPTIVNAPAGLAFGGAALVRFDKRGRPLSPTDQAINIGALAVTVTQGTGRVR